MGVEQGHPQRHGQHALDPHQLGRVRQGCSLPAPGTAKGSHPEPAEKQHAAPGQQRQPDGAGRQQVGTAKHSYADQHEIAQAAEGRRQQMVVAVNAPAQHEGILGTYGDDHGKAEGKALQCGREHGQTFVWEIWGHYKGRREIREIHSFSDAFKKLIRRGKKRLLAGCQLQDLTIVGPQPRPENRRQDGTAQDSGDGDRGDARRRAGAAGPVFTATVWGSW
ncbi:hypothetical protein D3C84_597610 [compost metagenome]